MTLDSADLSTSRSLSTQSVTSSTSDDGWVASVRVNVVGKELQGGTYAPLPELYRLLAL